MADNTKIEYCDATLNFITGCSFGCSYCYARPIANRFKPQPGETLYWEYGGADTYPDGTQ